jgi:hypothetical protein
LINILFISTQTKASTQTSTENHQIQKRTRATIKKSGEKTEKQRAECTAIKNELSKTVQSIAVLLVAAAVLFSTGKYTLFAQPKMMLVCLFDFSVHCIHTSIWCGVVHPNGDQGDKVTSANLF